ncbi:uncharacterized protein [Procambarus clarkii]|uniref:uncharacterized protein n=1 Tax=Procambarus clarkii TaxID=6728 RepID=UPI003744651B
MTKAPVWQMVIVAVALGGPLATPSLLGGPSSDHSPIRGSRSAYNPLGLLRSQPESLAELRERLSGSSGASPLLRMVLGERPLTDTASTIPGATGYPSASTPSGMDAGTLAASPLGDEPPADTSPGSTSSLYSSTNASDDATVAGMVMTEASPPVTSSGTAVRYLSTSVNVTGASPGFLVDKQSRLVSSPVASKILHLTTSTPSATEGVGTLQELVLDKESSSRVRSDTPSTRHPSASNETVIGSLINLVLGEEPVSDTSPGVAASTRSPSSTHNIYFNKATTQNSVLGSLFEIGVGDIKNPGSISKKNNKQKLDLKKLAPLSDIIKELNNMTLLPLVPMGGASQASENDVGDKVPLMQYLNGLRGDAWAQFKSLALGYSNWLDHEYEIQHMTEKLPLDLIKKVLDLGDKVNFLHVVGKRVDPGLAGYIADQLQPLFDHFEALTAGRLLDGSLSASVGGIVRNAAWKAMHQFVGHVLKVAGNIVTRDELEQFKDDLAKTSPLAARGLELILNGPSSLPLSGRPEAVEGRSMMNRNGYSDQNDGYSRDGATYGSQGAYDESFSSYGAPSYGSAGGIGGYSAMGYTSKVHLDPYLILGGLGAAVLLAYLAYRVLVTTEGMRRSHNDLTFMDLSDMPGVVHSIYTMLEGADDKYRSRRSSSSLMDDSDDLAQELNSLWTEHENVSGCVRCLLFKSTVEHTVPGHSSFQGLVVASVAHLLGAERSGQLVDEVTSLILEGTPVTCEREANSCVLK